MWQHQELRDVYRKHGWKEADFVSRGGGPTGGGGSSSSGGRGAPGSPGGGAPGANSTLSRPMASQGGTRYEDRTIKRSSNQHRHGQVRTARFNVYFNQVVVISKF